MYAPSRVGISLSCSPQVTPTGVQTNAKGSSASRQTRGLGCLLCDQIPSLPREDPCDLPPPLLCPLLGVQVSTRLLLFPSYQALWGLSLQPWL